MAPRRKKDISFLSQHFFFCLSGVGSQEQQPCLALLTSSSLSGGTPRCSQAGTSFTRTSPEHQASRGMWSRCPSHLSWPLYSELLPGDWVRLSQHFVKKTNFSTQHFLAESCGNVFLNLSNERKAIEVNICWENMEKTVEGAVLPACSTARLSGGCIICFSRYHSDFIHNVLSFLLS